MDVFQSGICGACFISRKKTSRSPSFDQDGFMSGWSGRPVVTGSPSGCPNRPTWIRPFSA
jgi:hypothetical protein